MNKDNYVFAQLVGFLDNFKFLRIVKKKRRRQDTKAMPEIPYEAGAHYIFDRGYNDFGNLYTIHRIGAFFVVRAKTNVRFRNDLKKLSSFSPLRYF